MRDKLIQMIQIDRWAALSLRSAEFLHAGPGRNRHLCRSEDANNIYNIICKLIKFGRPWGFARHAIEICSIWKLPHDLDSLECFSSQIWSDTVIRIDKTYEWKLPPHGFIIHLGRNRSRFGTDGKTWWRCFSSFWHLAVLVASVMYRLRFSHN